MAIPSGFGTETLKTGYFTVTTTAEEKIINGSKHHIYTILSCTICNTAAADKTFDLYIAKNGGNNDYEILSDIELKANKTFIFNDRLVLQEKDHLIFKAGATCDIDIIVSYIDQDWSE